MVLMFLNDDSRAPVHINSLATDSTCTPNTSGVLTRSGIDDGIDHNLKRIFSCKKMDDPKGVLDYAHGHDLLSIVTPMHHQRASETFNNGTLRFAETLHLISAS